MTTVLLLRFIRGETDEPESARVRRWRRESPQSEESFQELKRLYLIAQACREPVRAGDPPAASEIILRAEARAGGEGRAGSHGTRGYRALRLATPLAASVAILAGGALAWQHGLQVTRGDPLVVEEFTTGRGESAAVRLSDASLIRLGPESRLQIDMSGSGRQVSLEGRAFFAIAPDERRPFRVVVPGGSARVLGTRFHLEADVSDTRLIVLEGSVALAGGGREVHVREGQMTQLRAGMAAEVVTAPSLAEIAASWMGQFLVFQNTPLSRVAREIEELYGVRIRITQPVLAERTLTMWFSERPLDEVLTVVCTVVDAACRIDGDQVTIGASEGDG